MAMLVRVVALGAVVAVGCGSPDGPYVPRYCDDTFRLDRAGVRISSLDGALEITAADEDVSELCGYGYVLGRPDLREGGRPLRHSLPCGRCVRGGPPTSVGGDAHDLPQTAQKAKNHPMQLLESTASVHPALGPES